MLGHARWGLLALAFLLTVSACAGQARQGGDAAARSTSGGADPASGPTPTTGVTVEEAEASSPPGDGDDAAGREAGLSRFLQQPRDLGREVVFTADVVVAVTDVGRAGRQAVTVVETAGGFVFGQETVADPEPRTVLTFKVAPEDFHDVLARLGGLGEVRTQRVSADDVTDRVVDLESRIATASASVERLRALLAEASDIEVIARLESQLLERETQLETLRGQLRTLQDQVALATIVLTLTEAAARPAIALAVTAYPGHDGQGLSCPGDATLAVEEGEGFTLCFEVTNTGDTTLAGLELRDTVLGVTLPDLVVVFGDPAGPIEPGQSVLLALEATAERDLRTRTTVTATPVDPEGEPLPGREAAATTTIFVDAVDPGGLPGFGDGLEASWELLVLLGRALVLAAGVALPFAWVPLVAWLVLRYRRPRPERAVEERQPASVERE